MKGIVLLLMLAVPASFAQELDQASMQAMMKHMTPGKEHAMLAGGVGSWKTETSMWMAPDAAPVKSEGTCETTMILGGRYLRSVYKGNMMGMPFEGEGLTAYDNTKKALYSTWIDNMGTSLTHMTGKYDPKTHHIVFEGTMVDPITGADLKIKTVTRHESKDKMVFEMYMILSDQEVKSMEIVHTRVS